MFLQIRRWLLERVHGNHCLKKSLRPALIFRNFLNYLEGADDRKRRPTSTLTDKAIA